VKQQIFRLLKQTTDSSSDETADFPSDETTYSSYD